MKKSDLARQLHQQGFNCAQSVLIASEDITGLPRETAQKVACGFGGGVRSGEVCGCISGGVMALGTCYEQAEMADVAKGFVTAFREKHGCVRCEDLLKQYGGKSNCEDMMAYATELVAQTLQEKDN